MEIWLVSTIAVAMLGLVSSYILILCMYYKVTEMDEALVRTGAGGPRVSLQGAMWVLPIFHKLTRVTLRTMKLDVKTGVQSEDGTNIGTTRGMGVLRSKDLLPLVLDAEVYVHIPPQEEYILNAARTLGEKADPKAYRTGSRGNKVQEGAKVDYEEWATEAIRKVTSEKLKSAIRSVVATMTLGELHSERLTFTDKIAQILDNDLKENGLVLETVTIESLDQEPISSIESRRADSVFDANAYKALTAGVETAKTDINRVQRDNAEKRMEQDTSFEKRRLELQKEQNLAAETQKSELLRTTAELQAGVEIFYAQTDLDKTTNVEAAALESSRIETEAAKDLEIFQDECNKDTEVTRADFEKQSERARLDVFQDIEVLEVSVNQTIESAGINAEELIQTTDIEKDRVLGLKRTETSQIVGVSKENAEAAIQVAVVAKTESKALREKAKELLVEAKEAEVAAAVKVTRQAQSLAETAAEAIKTAVEEERLRKEHIVPAQNKVEEEGLKKEQAITEAEAMKEQMRIKAEAEKAKVVLTAEAKKEELVLSAQAQQQEVVLQAEGEKQKQQKEGEGQRSFEIAIAEGEREGLILRAEGEKQEAVLQAEGIIAKGTAAESELGFGQAHAEAQRLENLAKVIGKEAELLSENTVVKYLLAKNSGELAGHLTNTVAAAFKPLENIEGMRILQVNTDGGDGGAVSPMATLMKNLAQAAPGGAILNELLQLGGSDKTVSDILENTVSGLSALVNETDSASEKS